MRKNIAALHCHSQEVAYAGQKYTVLVSVRNECCHRYSSSSTESEHSTISGRENATAERDASLEIGAPELFADYTARLGSMEDCAIPCVDPHVRYSSAALEPKEHKVASSELLGWNEHACLRLLERRSRQIDSYCRKYRLHVAGAIKAALPRTTCAIRRPKMRCSDFEHLTLQRSRCVARRREREANATGASGQQTQCDDCCKVSASPHPRWPTEAAPSRRAVDRAAVPAPLAARHVHRSACWFRQFRQGIGIAPVG